MITFILHLRAASKFTHHRCHQTCRRLSFHLTRCAMCYFDHRDKIFLKDCRVKNQKRLCIHRYCLPLNCFDQLYSIIVWAIIYKYYLHFVFHPILSPNFSYFLPTSVEYYHLPLFTALNLFVCSMSSQMRRMNQIDYHLKWSIKGWAFLFSCSILILTCFLMYPYLKILNPN